MKRSNYTWCHGSRVGNDTRQTSSDCRGLIANNRLFRLLHLSKSQSKGPFVSWKNMDTKACSHACFPESQHTKPTSWWSTTANNKEQPTSNKQRTTSNKQRTTNTNQPTLHQCISEPDQQPAANNQQPTAFIFSTVNPQPLRHLVLRSFQRTDRSCQRSWYEGIPQPPWSTVSRDTVSRMLCYVSEFSIP